LFKQRDISSFHTVLHAVPQHKHGDRNVTTDYRDVTSPYIQGAA